MDEYAEKLYRYSFSNPKRFKIYTRHDMVLEDWIEKDQKAQKNRTKTFDSDLNDAQKINWQKNQEVVNELIESVPHRAGGLNFYYKAHLLKDKKDPNFSVSGLVDHLTFCRVLDKHLDVDVVAARFPSE